MINFSTDMWSKATVQQLIGLLHKAPALWNIQSKQYTDRNIKADEVRKIATHMDITEDEVSKKN
jgi:hypothetical protein